MTLFSLFCHLLGSHPEGKHHANNHEYECCDYACKERLEAIHVSRANALG